jgi:hypothetical protein
MKIWTVLLTSFLLAGCLEVETWSYPKWMAGGATTTISAELRPTDS